MSSTPIMNTHLLKTVVALFLNLGVSNARDSQLNFEFTKGPGILDLESGSNDEQMLAASFASGLERAANLWRAVLDDSVTVNFTIDMDSGILPEGAGGGAIPAYEVYDYAQTVQPALVADRSSANDATAISSLPLPLATGIEFLTNDTTNIPAPRIRDDNGSINNTQVILTRANAKSLGLVPASDPATDGTILITNDLPTGINWDFDQENGIGRRSVDFIGLAIHEIGHQLGFFSGVDFLITSVDATSAAKKSVKFAEV